MKTSRQLLGAVSALALIAMSSAPALAAGTSAGDTITNNVSVSYNVGGVTQNAETASDSFTVDRRVNVNVNFIGAATNVSPGEQNAVIAFDVTNLSNDTVDLDLATALSGTSANIANFQVYIDDGDNVFDSGDTLVTYLDEVAEDEIVRVFVIADIGLGAVNADVFDVTLTANAHTAGSAGTLGAELVGTSGANNVNGVDTVLSDGAGDTDSTNDGAFSDTGRYTVAGALVTVAKASRVVSDPVNLTNNPKAIPGATVEYCITVANAANAATATDVDVTDDLPDDVTYNATFGIFVDGDATCANGTAGGTFTLGGGTSGADLVEGGLSDIAAGQTRSLYFRVEIN